MKHHIDIQNTLEPEPAYLPSTNQFEDWINGTLSELTDVSEMTLRIVDLTEIQFLNKTFRHIDKATNVLSFPAEIPDTIDVALLGDIVICSAVVEKEALAQQKAINAHWAHMVIHGTLHLLGYDHLKDNEADIMESKEIEILGHFGYPNPYNFLEEEILKK